MFTMASIKVKGKPTFYFPDYKAPPKIKQPKRIKIKSSKPIVYQSKGVNQYKRTLKEMDPKAKNANANLLKILDETYRRHVPCYIIATSELTKADEGFDSIVKQEYQELYPKNNDIERKIREAIANMTYKAILSFTQKVGR